MFSSLFRWFSLFYVMTQAQKSTSVGSLLSDYKAFSNYQVIKNLIVLSVGCLLALCAYDGLVMLQSTINQDGGIGVISVAVQFGFSCVTALLLPEYLFEKIGCKSVITICLILFVPYIASNFYPHWSLMIPSSILIGLFNSLYWAGQSSYLNHLSILYTCNIMTALTEKCNKLSNESVRPVCGQETDMNAQVSNHFYLTQSDQNKEEERNIIKLQTDKEQTFLKGITALENKEAIQKDIPPSWKGKMNAESNAKFANILTSTTARFFGIHGLIYQTCHVWGNLLSYYVLRIGATEDEFKVNSTDCVCGFDFCNIQTNCSSDNLKEPRRNLRNILIGVFVAVSILSVVLILLCLDELKTRQRNVTISWKYIAATCKQMTDKRQFLLIPMSLNIGVMQGFVMGDFTKDYVACAWGVHHVGLVTACLGATLALSSTLSGYLVKPLGRRGVFLAAKGLNIAVVVIMYLWKPTASKTYMFFIISGMLGAVLGTFWSQLRAFYGVLFKGKEGAAFANYQIWHAIGMAMTFAYSSFICTSVKIYIYLAFSSFGMICYLLAENMQSSEE